jgi:serine/threonine protein kinase
MMQEFASSPIVPNVYACGFGVNEENEYVSILVMDKFIGQAFSTVSNELLKNLDGLYQQYHFIHGDLIPENLVLCDDGYKLIDFGLSSAMFRGFFFCRYHVFANHLIPLLLKDRVMLNKIKKQCTKSCESIIHFIQKHRQGVDICTLFRQSFHLVDVKFRKKLHTCIGRYGLSLSKTTIPNPMYYSRTIITHLENIIIPPRTY